MTIALGALALLLSLSGLALLSRWYVTRRTVGVYDIGWCPDEQTEHLHRYDANGTRTCCACQCTTPTAVPR
ncbi:hypothetical protein GCM10010294_25360 [Streptomyces griseoloalbus]|uniref:hypothetical protein n=1 Tax=Streptomyces griseoloalbus TaxID=67303 RepID=UPI001875CAC1|nr:hypothetical protein GCM10010294_25360 [Streptomyces griseoloalbus]